MLKTLEHDLSEAVATLREKVARLQSDVAYLSDGQRAHSGSQVRTDQQLAHISTSLREVHVLISRMQRDVDCLGSAKTTTKSPQSCQSSNESCVGGDAGEHADVWFATGDMSLGPASRSSSGVSLDGGISWPIYVGFTLSANRPVGSLRGTPL